jgi:FkbM family methyltransferase
VAERRGPLAAVRKLRTALRSIKRLGRCSFGKDVLYRRDVHCKYRMFGRDGAQFAICPNLIDSASIVYSCGIGTDISFDLELIQCFGTQVHAFDPTPRSLEWLKTQNLPGQFRVYAYGIANLDGISSFALPISCSHVSHSMVLGRSHQKATVSAPVKRIGSIMKELGHTRIDLLKMDIEGAEYDVIDDLVNGAIPIRQLCIEFHHRWPEIGVTKTRRAIDGLRASGYRIFYTSETGEEYSFLG